MLTRFDLEKALQQQVDPEKQQILQRFFKTGPGEYGEGDIFLGIKVPQLRKIAKNYQTLPLKEIETLLLSHWHEYRFVALILLIHRYAKSNHIDRKAIFNFYLKNTQYVNNWDLVDISAPKIVGNYLLEQPREVLHQLAYSTCLWEKRIAIIATLTFIKNNEFNDTLDLATLLLEDQHDLIQKAVGWMLREVGKRNQSIEEAFLKQYSQKMPRTMLRYAIEKFDEELRRFYLKK